MSKQGYNVEDFEEREQNIIIKQIKTAKKIMGAKV